MCAHSIEIDSVQFDWFSMEKFNTKTLFLHVNTLKRRQKSAEWFQWNVKMVLALEELHFDEHLTNF